MSAIVRPLVCCQPTLQTIFIAYLRWRGFLLASGFLRRDYLFDVIRSLRRRFHVPRGPQCAGNPERIGPSLTTEISRTVLRRLNMRRI